MKVNQYDVHYEGNVDSNGLINGLNTKIFQDIGTNNNIKINIDGYENFIKKDIIANLNELLNIPLNIRKNTNFGNFTTMTIKVNDFSPVSCQRKTKEGLNNEMISDMLKHDDIFTATYNGSFFIIESTSVNDIEIQEAISNLSNKIETSENSLEEDLSKHVKNELPHSFTKGGEIYNWGLKVDDDGSLIFVYEQEGE